MVLEGPLRKASVRALWHLRGGPGSQADARMSTMGSPAVGSRIRGTLTPSLHVLMSSPDTMRRAPVGPPERARRHGPLKLKHRG